MIDTAVIPAFLLATAVIMIAPGPDMMFMIGTGLSAGRKGGVVAAFGVTAGVTVYVVGSALGLAALIDGRPGVLDAIRLAGAGYLAYLAWSTWSNADAKQSFEQDVSTDLREIFRRGFTVNITNPKMVLFIAAFIPKFVDPSRGRAGTQFLIFAVSFQLVGLLIDLVLGTASGSARRLLVNKPGALLRLNHFAAAMYLAIAIWLIAEAVGWL